MGDNKQDASQYSLVINPESTLQFILSRATNNGGEPSTPKCTMTLKHPGTCSDHIAFKVKTTQPRRYLVRPNQGLIRPGDSETVSIILVEKDKQVLLQSYDRLGQSALDHSKDKFLVQSTGASEDFVQQFGAGTTRSGGDSKANKDLTDALTSMWNTASSLPVVNKKLHVKHIVADSAGGSASGLDGKGTAPGGFGGTMSGGAAGGNNSSNMPMSKLPPAPTMENMTPEQMFNEVSNLRRKYDELVAFSVNLTAERDILNNTLEQTKRDLNREMALRASIENDVNSGGLNSQRSNMKTAAKKSESGFLSGMLPILVLCLAVFVMGIKAGMKGEDSPFAKLPLLSKLFEE